MGNKIFVSYKFADSNVAPLKGRNVTVRDYVDTLETYFDNTSHIYKGESNDEDLSHFTEETIWEKLKDRIYDSSVTLVLISPNMRDPNKTDRSQWIPWEIAYSLRETTRADYTSHTNAVLAIVLPDSNESYNYFLCQNTCCYRPCRTLKTNSVFKILHDNMFNRIDKQKRECSRGEAVYSGESSYILSVTWDDFCKEPDSYIKRAIAIREDADSYEIVKEV